MPLTHDVWLDRLGDAFTFDPDGCWRWQRSRFRHGYGRIRINGRDGLAHRALYELLEGPIPAGLEIDHLCRVRHCVNPGHMRAVTHAENLRRRARATHCRRGHEYTFENTYVWRGKRFCCTCRGLPQRSRVAAEPKEGAVI